MPPRPAPARPAAARLALPPLEQSRLLRHAAAFGLYVMQGVPAGFAMTAVANRLAAAGVAPPAIGRFVALVGVPWTVQFLWGPLIDRFQGSPMGRRKPWVLFAQLLAAAASLAIALVGDPVRHLGALTAAFVFHSVVASVQDASGDAMAISVTRPEERTSVNACMRAGFLAGEAIGAAGLAAVMSRRGFTAAALTQTAVLVALTAATFLVRERAGDRLVPWGRRAAAPAPAAPAPAGAPADAPADAPPTLRAILAALRRGLLAPESVRMFAAVIAVYFAASVFIRTLNTHLVQGLRWDDTRLSVLTGTYGMGAAAAAIAVVGLLATRLSPRRLLLGVVAVIGAYLVAVGLLAPLWPNAPFMRAALVLWYTADPGYSVAAMPVLMTLCARGVEGSQFTTYMALVNLADVAGNVVSGYAITVLPAPAIVLACAAVVWAAFEAVRRSPFGRPPAQGWTAPSTDSASAPIAAGSGLALPSTITVQPSPSTRAASDL